MTKNLFHLKIKIKNIEKIKKKKNLIDHFFLN